MTCSAPLIVVLNNALAVIAMFSVLDKTQLPADVELSANPIVVAENGARNPSMLLDVSIIFSGYPPLFLMLNTQAALVIVVAFGSFTYWP